MHDIQLTVVDNYDSFTHNIVHALELAGARCHVVKNDEQPGEALLRGDGIVLSAGPCAPAKAGVCGDVVRALLAPNAPRIPLLGICLGHQTIAQAMGARIVRATRPMHGKTTHLRHDRRGCLAPIADGAPIVRYNSLTVDATSLPDALEACGWDDDGDLMALRHRELPFEGVQFHPESWLAPTTQLLEAWVRSCATAARRAG